MLTLLYEEGGKCARSDDPAVLPRVVAEEGRCFWLDLEAPTPEEFRLLGEVLHFHPLAVEDAMQPHQRPKLDEYEGYVFLTADEVVMDPSTAGDADDVPARQMSAFLGEHYLVTIHVEPVEAVRELRDRAEHRAEILKKGSDFTLYTLLDTLVDAYFPLLDALDDRIDDLEDQIVQRPRQNALDTIFTVKRQLNRLRRHVGPLRQVLQTLTSRDVTGVREATLPYFRDVADHVFRIYDSLDGYRDLMSNMLDAYLSQVSNEMNRVMQKLSVVATVFLPITFITGVFGMNFQDQPWLKTSFWFWMAIMAVLALGTYVWFRKRHWV